MIKMTEEELRKELAETQSKLLKSEKDQDSLQRKLQRAERHLEKSKNYNEDLCIQIEELSQKLAKYKTKKVDVAIQTTYEAIVAETSYNNWLEEATAKQVTVAESVEAAAQEAMQEIGLTYDENSGMNYDYMTGYYYNEDRSFYYDPSSGIYYYYDHQTQSYQFHSQIDPSSWTEQNVKVKKKRRKKKIKDEDKTKEESVERKSEAEIIENKSETESVERKSEAEIIENKSETKSVERKSESEIIENKPETGSKPEAENNKMKPEDQYNEIESKAEIITNGSDAENKAEVDLKKSKSKNENKIDELVTDNESPVEILSHLASHNSDTETQDQNEMNCNVIIEKNDDEEDIDSAQVTVKLSDNEDSLLEEGECSITSVSETDCSTDDDDDVSSIEEDKQELKECWPPCIRVMVIESSVLAAGTLFIVTASGASIGREQTNDIILPEVQVSKMHACFQFDESQWQYSIIDLGSRNTTLLNSSLLSKPKEKSDAHIVKHGDELVIGTTKLLLHIHDSTDTCDMCEPGLVQALNQTKVIKEIAVLSKEEKEKMRRKELKQIKKRFGLENSHHEGNENSQSKGYKDRSAVRRRIKGSDVPHEKKIEIEPASVHRPITSENKGFKMMEKMGWNTGEGLGKEAKGIVNPVEVGIRSGQSGLGSSHSITLSLDHVRNLPKLKILNKTIERYYGNTPKKMKKNE